MKLTTETKLFIGIFGVTAALVGIAMFFMTRPAKPVAKETLILPTTQTKGPVNAPVWLVEFSDFQCPACQAFSGTVAALAAKYPNDLLIAYRYFPLDIHAQAKPAAFAAEAAAKQGKFWEMESLLFANQDTLSLEKYQELATGLGLDMTKFNQAYDDTAVHQTIQTDVDAGNALGINATPTFYLNGQKLTLTSLADLTDAVDQAVQTNTKK